MNVRVGDAIRGAAGEAWPVEIIDHDKPDTTATIATWFLHCPRQSPAWDRYGLSIVSLRDIDGVPPANVRVLGATHEVLLLAFDPKHEPRADDPNTWVALRPINVCEQVTLPDDDAARELLTLAARAVVNGVLFAEPPLSVQGEPWRTSLIKTSAHLRGEEHAP
jgi:hypothetical protein